MLPALMAKAITQSHRDEPRRKAFGCLKEAPQYIPAFLRQSCFGYFLGGLDGPLDVRGLNQGRAGMVVG